MHLFSPLGLTQRTPSFWTEQSSILLRPLSMLFATNKQSYWYDWKVVNKASVEGVEGAITRSKSPVYTIYNTDITLRGLIAHFGKVQEAAIVSPKQPVQSWNLIFCSTEDNVCKESNLVHQDAKIKVLIDGELKLWGRDQNGDVIPLKVETYTTRNEYPEILFI